MHATEVQLSSSFSAVFSRKPLGLGTTAFFVLFTEWVRSKRILSWIIQLKRYALYLKLLSTKVFVLDGNSEICGYVRRNIVKDIWFVREPSQIGYFFSEKGVFFVNACATCSESPSYISTVISTVTPCQYVLPNSSVLYKSLRSIIQSYSVSSRILPDIRYLT